MEREIILVLFALFLFLHPVSASTADINFQVSVSPETLHPGDDIALTLFIENEAVISNFFVNESTYSSLQLITTAKDLKVELYPKAWIPIEVETINPQIIGDLPPGRIATATFKIKVPEDAELGEYKLPVRLTYTEVSYSTTSTGAIVSYSRDTGLEVDYVKLEIKKRDYDFSVKSIKSDITAGRGGVVDVTIKNTGENTLYEGALILNCTPPLRTNPKAMSAYIGELKSGEEANVRFKVYAMEGTFNHSYPANLILMAKTSSNIPVFLEKKTGIEVKSDNFGILDVESFITPSKTVRVSKAPSQPAIPFQPQASFPSISSTSITTIPSRGFVSLKIINHGEDIQDAFAVLSFDSPLLKAENSPYIGDLKHGETKEVTFYVTSKASPGEYSAYVMLNYKNSLGDREVSPKNYISVNVNSNPALEVKKVETRNLGVGMTGEVEITLDGEAKNVELYIVPSNPLLKPVSPSAYITEMNGSSKAKFRISVSSDAFSGLQNLYMVERFDRDNLKDLVSIAEFRVNIESKLAYFQIISVESKDLHPDSTGEINLKIKNAGNVEIYNAVAFLDVTPPFTISGGSSIGSLVGVSQPGSYFLGTMKPGEIAVAKFRVDVDKDAGEGSYPASVRIQYYDENGYLHISNSIIISVDITTKPPYTLIVASGFAAIGLALAVRFARKKRKNEK